MMMPGRKYAAGSGYRYGFNGKENDDEVKGESNFEDYGMRPYDVRLGRLITVDPLTPEYSYLTPYQFAENSPIENIDFLGLQGATTTGASVPTLPTLSNTSYSRNGTYTNSTQLINGPINSGALSPQVRFITQNEFEDIVPPYGSAYVNADKISAAVSNATGKSWQVSLLKEQTEYVSLADVVKDMDEQFKSNQRFHIAMNFKKTIWTEKATPLILKPLNTYQAITTDVDNLKGQDILDLKDRIVKGTATEQDRIHAAALVRERIDFQLNPKHDKNQPAGDASASVAPSNHAELWDKRTTYIGETDTWWSIEGEGKKAVFHRFKGDKNGTYHWSGSTGQNVNRAGQPVKPVMKDQVPTSTKKKAGYKKG